jgi:preprotein translocase subunit SecD
MPRARAQRLEVVEQTRQILERRINAYGLSEAPVQLYGSRGNELLAQLPGVSDPSRIANLLQSRAVLEWYSLEDGPYASTGDAMARYDGFLPFNRKLLATRPAADGQITWYVLDRHPIIRGIDLRRARVSADATGQPVTTFTLSQDAAKRFERYTQAKPVTSQCLPCIFGTSSPTRRRPGTADRSSNLDRPSYE